MNKKLICVSGLPRSGSTLLCQLLNQHPEIYSIGHSSPLCGAINNIRHNISDSDFMLSQLDCDFDLGYQRLKNAYMGFIKGWFQETKLSAVVDKNRGWLRAVEMLNELVPDYRILVCVRNPIQIFGSIEAQHAKTRLLDFPDHIDAHGARARADRLFGNNGIVGLPLNYIRDINDIIDQNIQQRIFYVPFEELVNKPQDSFNTLLEWMELPKFDLDTKNMETPPHESDSYYRFKYPHATRASVGMPKPHTVTPHIEKGLVDRYRWFFQRFYPAEIARINKKVAKSEKK